MMRYRGRYRYGRPMGALTLSRRDARRLAVRAQWLQWGRMTDVVEVTRRLTLLQLDPTAAVAPSAHLVAWSRIGSRYDPAELEQALKDRRLIEYRATIRPAEDMALYRADMQHWSTGPLEGWQRSFRAWVMEKNTDCRREILHRLEDEGPLTSRELPDLCAVPWRSSGWTNNRNVSQMLEIMVRLGDVAVAGRRGKERLWDLADRVYPDDPVPPLEESQRRRDQRRLAALGIARSRGPECAIEPLDVRDAGVEALVDGVRGTWRVDPQLLDQPFTGRAALLSPFDRLLHDRKRMAELFEFDYTLEMYKPVAQRKWGYFALPVLSGDRLVGKLDARADRKAGVLRVAALHWDVEPSTAMAAAVDREIADLARWLDLELSR
jgi:uncharacterized protein YcaQ